MEWSRIKSILICVFIVVNVFLLITYIRGAQTGITITDDTIADMITILNNNQVSIDPELVPKKVDNIRVFDAASRYASMEELAADLLAEAGQVQTTETTFSCTGLPNQTTQTRLTERSAKRYAERQVKQLGLLGDMDVTIGAVKTEEGYTVSFTPAFENRSVLDVCLYAKVTPEGVTKLFGANWLIEHIDGGAFTNIQSPVDSLVQFAATREQPCAVTHLELGYFIGSRGGQSVTVTAVPVWEIITHQGETFYFDARNGDLLS